MLRLTGLESIERLLGTSERLAALLSQRAPTFVDAVEQWLSDVEAALTRYRLPQAPEIAAARAGLIAARRRGTPDGHETGRRPSRARILDAAAVQALQRATEVVSQALAPTRSRFGEAEAITRKTISVARFRTLVRTELPVPVAAAALWRALRSTAELAGGAVALEGLVGAEDAITLIERDLVAYPPADGADGRRERVQEGLNDGNVVEPERREVVARQPGQVSEQHVAG